MMRTIKPCKHEGCEQHAYARAMCKNHYRQWLRKNPGGVRKIDSTELAIQAMPATIGKIMEEAEVCEKHARRIVARLRGQGQSHIGEWLPPAHTQGGQWKPVHHFGPGEDAVIDREAHAIRAINRQRARTLANYYKRKPVSFAALLAPLGV